MKRELIAIIKDVHKNRTEELINNEDVRFILFDSRNSDLLFVFIKKQNSPSYVIKICWQENLKKQMDNEYSGLVKINKLESEVLNETLPTPLFNGVINNHQVIVECMCSGELLNNYIISVRKSRIKTERIIAIVTNWLIELHKNSQNKNHLMGELVNGGLVSEIINKYKGVQKLNEDELSDIGKIFGEVQANTAIPAVMQHGDFSSWNMLYNKKAKKISILDWEYLNMEGLPLIDLLNFMVIYESIIRGFEEAGKSSVVFNSFSANIHYPKASAEDFINIFYEKNWRSEISWKYILKYCEMISLDKKALKSLFLIFICKHLFFEKEFLLRYLQKGEPGFIVQDKNL